jgi:hypothetical protein
MKLIQKIKTAISSVKRALSVRLTVFEVMILFVGAFFLLATILDPEASREVAFLGGLSFSEILYILIRKYRGE